MKAWLTPDRAARLIAGGALGMTVANILLGRWVEAWLMASLALMLVLNIQGRKAAYYKGWVDGRINLMVTMNEAQRRGLTVGEATTSVVEKDLSMMGEYLGRRSAQKFWTNLQAEMARRDDGSHEDL